MLKSIIPARPHVRHRLALEVARVLRMLPRAINLVLLHFLVYFCQERFPYRIELAACVRIADFIVQQSGKDSA